MNLNECSVSVGNIKTYISKEREEAGVFFCIAFMPHYLCNVVLIDTNSASMSSHCALLATMESNFCLIPPTLLPPRCRSTVWSTFPFAVTYVKTSILAESKKLFLTLSQGEVRRS